ncbi:MAG: DNA alkylation repair protein [Bryobacteraceae bacterium]
MTRVEALAAEIREYCASHADRKQARRWERYFTEGYDAWGLLDKNDPLWHQKQTEWLEGYRDIGLRGFLKLGEILFRSGKYEEGALAIRFAVTFRDQFDQKAVERLGKWFEAGIRNWAHTDVLCGEIIAPLLESGRVELETLAPWRESELKFQRRAVPVAMLRLLKVKPDAGPLLGRHRAGQRHLRLVRAAHGRHLRGESAATAGVGRAIRSAGRSGLAVPGGRAGWQRCNPCCILLRSKWNDFSDPRRTDIHICS